jgi:hypothetical protein
VSLPEDPDLWTWSISYDSWELGAVNADYDPADSGFEIAFVPTEAELLARVDVLRQLGFPEAVLQRALDVYCQGVTLGTLGKPHKPSWR